MATPSLRRSLPFALAVAALLLGAGRVAAEEPMQLHDRVTDLAGVLDAGDVQVASDAIAALDDEANVQLFALFVDSVEGMTVTDFADEVARLSSLGGNDAVLVVAVGDRLDALWVGPALDAASDDEIDAILADGVEPQLRDGAWGAAVAAAAEGLADALVVAPPASVIPTLQPTPRPSAEPSGGAGGGFPWGLLLGAGLVLAGAAALYAWWRRSQLAGLDAEERDRRVGALARQANAQLIEIDELIRDDAQELAFAEAEFGKEAAATFVQALDAARGELRAAFAVRQRLDDRDPETPEQREAMLGEIVQRTTHARALLEEQTKLFAELRDLERRAPEVLAAQAEAIAAVEARLPDAERQLAALQRDAASSSRSVSGHLAEAGKRLALAGSTSKEGQAALARDDRAAAGRAAMAARDATTQAGALLDAIGRASEALESARTNLSSALAQARVDVAAAIEAARGSNEAAIAEGLARAQAQLQEAEAAGAAGATDAGRDLVEAYRKARAAEAEADQVVAAAQEGRERRAREVAAADASIKSAELSVDRAEDFVRSRRHGVQRRPRTRLSEADEALALARSLRDADPGRAAGEARRAGQLADEAYRLASDEFERAQRAGYGGTVVINGQHYPTGRGSSWGSDVGGAILGGIIGSILSGGGGRRGGPPFGGFGGGGGRSFGGGFGSRGGGGRSRGGAW